MTHGEFSPTPTTPETITMGKFTLASERHEDRNEDSAFIHPASASMGVFDGMGGYSGSELASSLACQAVEQEFRQTSGIQTSEIGGVALVEEALEKAHRRICEEGPGEVYTTAAIVRIFQTPEGDPYAVIGKVGDSRAYLAREGDLKCLTFDGNSTVADAPADRLDLQAKLADVTDLSTLNDSEKVAFKHRHVAYDALGDSTLGPTIIIETVSLLPGDRIILSSDGIHDNLTTDEVARLIFADENDSRVAESLVEFAQVRSRDIHHDRHKPDDMTAAVLTYKG